MSQNESGWSVVVGEKPEAGRSSWLVGWLVVDIFNLDKQLDSCANKLSFFDGRTEKNAIMYDVNC